MGNDAAKMALYCIMSETDQNFVDAEYAPSIMLPSSVVTAENVKEITNRW